MISVRSVFASQVTRRRVSGLHSVKKAQIREAQTRDLHASRRTGMGTGDVPAAIEWIGSWGPLHLGCLQHLGEWPSESEREGCAPGPTPCPYRKRFHALAPGARVTLGNRRTRSTAMAPKSGAVGGRKK